MVFLRCGRSTVSVPRLRGPPFHATRVVTGVTRWQTLYRYPPKGRPLVLIKVSATGIMLKLPFLTNVDHVMLTKGPNGLGKHITDETVEVGSGRHQHLGRLTTATVPAQLLESLSAQLADDDIVYIIDARAIYTGPALESKNFPGRDLAPSQDLLKTLEVVDLDSIPGLRKGTWREARRSDIRHGLRKEDGDIVLYVQRLNGNVIRLPFGSSEKLLPLVAELSGVGPLFERAKSRLARASGGTADSEQAQSSGDRTDQV